MTTKDISGISILGYWAQFAYNAFRENELYAVRTHASGGFDDNWGRRFNDAGYSDLISQFQSKNSGSKGERGNDYTVWTGLLETRKLQNIRNDMANAIAGAIKRKVKGGDILRNTNGGKALNLIDNNSDRDVIYTVVTAVDRKGREPRYIYNSFGLAFYDFSLSVLSDTGADELAEAIRNDNPIITEKVLEEKKFSNKSQQVQSGFNVSRTTSESESVTNSTTSSESFTFSQTIGVKTTIGVDTSKWEYSAAFTTSQMFDTSLTTGATHNKTASRTIGASNIIVQPGAEVTVKFLQKSYVRNFNYQVPVALNFSVAICSLSGDLYDDNALIRKFGTPGYEQKHFTMLFGNNSGNSRHDIVERKCAVHGFRDKHNDGASANVLNEIKFSSFMGKNPVSKNTPNNELALNTTANNNVLLERLGTRQPMFYTGLNFDSAVTIESISIEGGEAIPLEKE